MNATLWRIVWSDHSAEHEACFQSKDEVLSFIQKLHAEERELRPAAEILSPGGPWMSIALGFAQTILLLDASESPPCFVSVGDPLRDGESPVFCHGMQGIDYLARSMIRVDAGFEAIAEFLDTRARPANVIWELL
jgi:hypothetical protein